MLFIVQGSFTELVRVIFYKPISANGILGRKAIYWFSYWKNTFGFDVV